MIGPPVEKLPDAIPKRRSSTSDLTRTPLKAQQTSALPLTPKNDTLKSSRKGKKRLFSDTDMDKRCEVTCKFTTTLFVGEANGSFAKAHSLGIPVKGVENLKNQLFGLEANFEKLQAIDFKKGCFIGQENTARMKLKNKTRKKLLPLKSNNKFNVGNEVVFNNTNVGSVLIDGNYPFALIKLYNPDLKEFINKELMIGKVKGKIINSLESKL